jgi:hypothetical protein
MTNPILLCLVREDQNADEHCNKNSSHSSVRIHVLLSRNQLCHMIRLHLIYEIALDAPVVPAHVPERALRKLFLVE